MIIFSIIIIAIFLIFLVKKEKKKGSHKGYDYWYDYYYNLYEIDKIRLSLDNLPSVKEYNGVRASYTGFSRNNKGSYNKNREVEVKDKDGNVEIKKLDCYEQFSTSNEMPAPTQTSIESLKQMLTPDDIDILTEDELEYYKGAIERQNLIDEDRAIMDCF